VRDKPIVIEVVDTRDRIDAYLAAVELMIGSGLITIEDIGCCATAWRPAAGYAD